MRGIGPAKAGTTCGEENFWRNEAEQSGTVEMAEGILNADCRMQSADFQMAEGSEGMTNAKGTNDKGMTKAQMTNCWSGTWDGFGEDPWILTQRRQDAMTQSPGEVRVDPPESEQKATMIAKDPGEFFLS